MPAVEIRGGVKIEIPDKDEIGAVVRQSWVDRDREKARTVKWLDSAAPGTTPAGLAQANYLIPGPESGYAWSAKVLGVVLSAAGTVAVYKASSTGQRSRPIGQAVTVNTAATTVTTSTLNSSTAQGSAVNPAAGGVITSVAGVVAGTYTVRADVMLNGTVTAADQSNMQIAPGALPVAKITYPGVANTNTPTSYTETITLTATSTVIVQAIANASGAAATYSADLVITPTSPTVVNTITGGTNLAVITWSSNAGYLQHDQALWVEASQNISTWYLGVEEAMSEAAWRIFD